MKEHGDVPGRLRLTHGQVAEIQRQARSGRPLRRIAVDLAVSYSAVYDVVRGRARGGLPILTQHGRARFSADECVKLFLVKRRETLTNKQLAQRFGVSKTTATKAVVDGELLLAHRAARLLRHSDEQVVCARLQIARSELDRMLAITETGSVPKRLLYVLRQEGE